MPHYRDRLDARAQILDEPIPRFKRADDGSEFNTFWITERENAWRLAEAGFIPFTDDVKKGRFDRSIASFNDMLEPGTLPVADMARRGADAHAVLRELCRTSLASKKPNERYSVNVAIATVAQAYCYGIPNRAVLERIKAFASRRVLEIGAGKGYWSRLLSNLGCTVEAFDIHDEDWGSTSPVRELFGKSGEMMENLVKEPWFDVGSGGAEMALDTSSSDTLLMVWPSKHDFATDAVDFFVGDRLVYVGEPRGLGCAEDSFFDRMRVGWTLVDVVEIPTMPWHEDRAFFYERKKSVGSAKRQRSTAKGRTKPGRATLFNVK